MPQICRHTVNIYFPDRVGEGVKNPKILCMSYMEAPKSFENLVD